MNQLQKSEANAYASPVRFRPLSLGDSTKHQARSKKYRAQKHHLQFNQRYAQAS
ncbi:hypothetical protein [Paenibacillus glucanolyticus]|uniref:hypothetical protein n=1 Tax=Paenibacillus glucanolyticus TaxID=59843 RepID=UPI000AD033BD|nr:hypothetical protein [Paenibacillus glucanolyticus]